MKRIMIEIDDRFVTEWGMLYFGVISGENGLEFMVPPAPYCLPGFKYVIHPEPLQATFKITEIKEPEEIKPDNVVPIKGE